MENGWNQYYQTVTIKVGTRFTSDVPYSRRRINRLLKREKCFRNLIKKMANARARMLGKLAYDCYSK